MQNEEDITLEDHNFDIDNGSLYYLCKNKALGSEEWTCFNESKKFITKYWRNIDDHVPSLVKSLISDPNTHINDCICLKDDNIYVLKNDDHHHYLVPKSTLQNQKPDMIMDYDISKFSSL